jgi:hypothetical protein
MRSVLHKAGSFHKAAPDANVADLVADADHLQVPNRANTSTQKH